MVREATITCPSCGDEIKLNESLAAPLIEATRAQYEKKLTDQKLEFTKREQAVKTREEQLAKEKESLDATLNERLKTERDKLAADAAKRDQVLKAREEQLTKEKESLDATLSEKLKDERAKLAADSAKREQALKEREAALAKEKETADATIAEKLKAERAKIAADELKRAKLALGDELDQKAKQLAELNDVLKQRDAKLAEAQKAQAELIKMKRDLEDAKREIDLTIQKQVAESIGAARDKAKKEAEDELSLKLIERDEKIAAMARQVEDLKKKAEQGSQQAQGEALETELESILKSQFPFDLIEPVPTGTRGADVRQVVRNERGQACGMILWESKNTQSWKDEFVTKLLANGRSCNANVCAIMTVTMPKDLCNFGEVQGVWVTNRECVVGVASCLRSMLVELGDAKRAIEGQSGKMERVYHYLTGTEFRTHMTAIVKSFGTMRADIEKERTTMGNHWKKREKQLELARDAALSVHGSVIAIAGGDVQPIDGTSLDALENHERDLPA